MLFDVERAFRSILLLRQQSNKFWLGVRVGNQRREGLMELNTAWQIVRRWQLPGDDVRSAVRAILNRGTEEDKRKAFDLFVTRLREPATGPDYDHADQLEDGRVEMYWATVHAEVRFSLEMLQILNDPRTADTLRSFPQNARGYSEARQLLGEIEAWRGSEGGC
jgi:hypothetical protein